MINTTQNIATKHHLEHSLKANISCFQVNYDNNGVWQQTRHIGWTEDNRITNIIDKSYHSYYSYDDGGERVLKITGPSTILDVNADMISYQSTLKNVTLYTSPYLVAHNKGYTKHFYAGSERVCAAIGEGGLNSLTPCIGNDQTLKNTTNALFNSTIESMGGRFLLENQSCLINTGDVPNELLAEFENVAVNVKLSSGVDASIFHTAINKYCSQNKANSAVYYYHSDHLGSASWITNKTGTPVQHLQYMPYGEPLVNEKTTSYEERFTFTGKERDSETGYSYFGARFYDSDLMTGWLSVDPMADKYPGLSPYAYCGWNPVKLVDPNGEEIILSKSAKEIHDKYYNKNEEYTKLYNQLNDRSDILFVVGEINKGENIDADRKVGGTLVEIYPEEGELYSDFNGSVYSLEWGSPQPEYGGNEIHVFMEEMYHAKQVLDFNNNNGTIEKEVRAKEFAIRMNPSVFEKCTDSWGRSGVPTQLGIISEGNFTKSCDFLKNGLKSYPIIMQDGEFRNARIEGAYKDFPIR